MVSQNRRSRIFIFVISSLALGWLTGDGQARERRTTDAIFQQMFTAENLRRPEDAVFDAAALSPDLEIRGQCAKSLGRIGDQMRKGLLLSLLDDQEATVRQQAAWALGYVYGDDTRQVLVQKISADPDIAVTVAAMGAIARNGVEDDQLGLLASFQSLETRFGDSFSLLQRSKALESLAVLMSKATRTWHVQTGVLEILAEHALTFGSAQAGVESDVALAAAYGLARYKGSPDLVPPLLTAAFQGANNQVVRGFLATALARTGKSEAKVLLESTFDEPGVGWRLLVDTVRSLGLFPCDADSVQAFAKAYRYGTTSNQPKIQVLETAAACGDMAHDVAELAIEEFPGNPSTWLQSSILTAIADIAPAMAMPEARQAVDQDQFDILPAAATVLAKSVDPQDAVRLWGLLGHRRPAVVAGVLDIATAKPDAELPADLKTQTRAAISRGDLSITISAAALIKEKKWSDLSDALVQALTVAHVDDVEVKVALLEALGTVGDRTVLPAIDVALNDGDRSVVVAAAAAWKAITGDDVSNRIPPASRVSAVTPGAQEVADAIAATVRLETTRGVITVKMSEDAPLAAHNFVTLAKSGFYDGLLFHRVVPHFVAQGGDPRGDGYGGPGYLMRDEFSSEWHRRGTIGMASAGKDTAGSQFFFNLRPNMHLNGNYTVFGEIVEGLDVADLLEQGDVVQRAVVVPGVR